MKLGRAIDILEMILLALREVEAKGGLPDDIGGKRCYGFYDLVYQFGWRAIPELSQKEIDELMEKPLINLLPIEAWRSEIPILNMGLRIRFRDETSGTVGPGRQPTSVQQRAIAEALDKRYDRDQLAREIWQHFSDRVGQVWEGADIILPDLHVVGRAGQMWTDAFWVLLPLEEEQEDAG